MIASKLKHTKRVPCEIEGCESLNVSTKLSTDYCGKHYMRLSRGMDLEEPTIFDAREAIIEGDTALIPLGIKAKDGYAVVDREFAWVDKYRWRLSDGYAVTNSFGERGKNNRLHHLVYKKPSAGMMIDHKNIDSLDNRLCNLREVTPQINTVNRRIQRNNKSGYTGVRLHKDGKWVAYIRKDGKVTSKYGFETPEAASIIYASMRMEKYGMDITIKEGAY